MYTYIRKVLYVRMVRRTVERDEAAVLLDDYQPGDTAQPDNKQQAHESLQHRTSASFHMHQKNILGADP